MAGDKYMVRVRFTDGEPPMIIYFTEPKLDTIGIAPGLGNTYDQPIAQAHKLAQQLTTNGSSVRLDGAVIYIPVHRVKDATVEKMP